MLRPAWPHLGLISAVLLLLVSSGGLSKAETSGVYGPLLGCWKVVIDMPFPMRNRKLTTCFSSERNQFVGKVRQKEGKWNPLFDISMAGPTFTFYTNSKNGRVKFSGTIKGEKFKGRVKAKRGSRPIEGRRTKQ